MMMMHEKMKKIIAIAEKMPRKYPALIRIHKHKMEIKKALKEAGMEVREILEEHPREFPNAKEMMMHWDMWMEHHKK